MIPFDQLEHHCSKAELTPDLITNIRHFPVRQTMLQAPVNRTLEFAVDFMNFAEFIPTLVCTLGTNSAMSLF